MAPMAEVEVATRGFLIGGKWYEEGAQQEIRSPFDGSVVSRTWVGTRQHAEKAIASAVAAFGTTRRLPAFERQRVLRAIAQGITARREEFARMICLEAGKPINYSRFEVDRAVFIFAAASAWALRSEEACSSEIARGNSIPVRYQLGIFCRIFCKACT